MIESDARQPTPAPPPMDVQPVVLQGQLVRLEPLAARHMDDLVAAASNPSVWRWMPEGNRTADQIRAHVERALEVGAGGSQLPFATVERATGRAVGSTRYMNVVPEHRRLEIGWTWLAPQAQGRGLNDESKLLQLTHAFEVLRCRRVEFKTDSLNERSRGALTGIGATFEGIFRNHMTTPFGRMRHSAWYSVIDDEWPRVKAALGSRLEPHLAGRRSGSGSVGP